MILAAWIHDLDPFLIRFPDGFFLEGIRWYGLSYVAGFLGAAFLLRQYSKQGRTLLDADARNTLMTSIIIGALLGGRLGYMLFYDFDHFIAAPWSLFEVWQGGMASHGGFIGVVIALFWFARKSSVSFRELGDLAATMAPPGLLFGRIANFINGELWGKLTQASWGVIFPDSAPYRGMPVDAIPPRHPSQLYEAALEGGLMLLYTQWRFWRFPRLPKGQLAGEFLIGYALVRIFSEQFREPDASLILGMSRGAFYSIFLILAGVLCIYFARRRAAPD